jgi:hypothetical protein
VDGGERQVEIWTPDAQLPEVERVRLHWRPSGAAQPFALLLTDLFGET